MTLDPHRGIHTVATGLAALASAACQAEHGTQEPIGRVTQSIVGGELSGRDDDATVLVNEAGDAWCTGVLVASNLVLTARHCVTDVTLTDECGAPLGRDRPPTIYTVSIGTHPSPGWFAARATRLFVAPASEGVCGADLALLLLDRDLRHAPIAPLRFAPLAKDEPVSAVGYGSGERRRRNDLRVLARGPVARWAYVARTGERFSLYVPDNDIVTGEASCFGDSGGPLFDAQGRIVAVASRGPDLGCTDRPTVWTTVAPFASLLHAAASAAGRPLGEGSTDPLGDGAPAAGAAATGATTGPTASDRQAASACAVAHAGRCRPRGAAMVAWAAAALLALLRRTRSRSRA